MVQLAIEQGLKQKVRDWELRGRQPIGFHRASASVESPHEISSPPVEPNLRRLAGVPSYGSAGTGGSHGSEGVDRPCRSGDGF